MEVTMDLEDKKLLKKVLLIILIVWVSITLLVSAFHFYYFGEWSIPDPEIKHGEFPFKLVYRIGEETVTIEDTYVCEYIGKSASNPFNEGRFIIWEGYMKSTGDYRHVLLEDDGRALLYFEFYPDFCMGDGYDEEYIEIYLRGELPYPYRPTRINDNLTDEELLRHFDVEILHWEMAPPIKNKFTILGFIPVKG